MFDGIAAKDIGTLTSFVLSFGEPRRRFAHRPGSDHENLSGGSHGQGDLRYLLAS
jgi:hypothetical protein